MSYEEGMLPGATAESGLGESSTVAMGTTWASTLPLHQHATPGVERAPLQSQKPET